MKSWLGFVLAASAGIAAVWLAVRAPEAPVPRAATASSAVVALEAEVVRLRDELLRLRSAQGRSTPEHGAPVPSEPSATQRAITEASLASPVVESARSPAASRQPSDPNACLDEYVESVLARDESEHYRHLVAAYVVELAPRIAGLIGDENTPLGLRVRLMELFGDRRLRGHPAVMDSLVSIVRGPPEERVVMRALEALQAIGDPSAADAIEELVRRSPTRAVECAAVEVALALAADHRHEALRRLLANARTDGFRAYLISLLDPDRLAGALPVFELASTLEQPLRLQAAEEIGAFVDPSVAEFVRHWLEFETDTRVRDALNFSLRMSSSTPRWHARQAIGPPDAHPRNDDPKAWASATGDMGEQWLELGYTPARRCSLVRIHEVNSAGAVTAVVGIDESGGEHTLWTGVDPLAAPGVFEVKVPTTSFAVRKLRIVLDTDATPDWNEIDCVELVGPDGRAWASEARASSWFGGSN